ncbi:MAG: hypothetical protein RBJ76_08110 [Stenomitos frigidus ULC029]
MYGSLVSREKPRATKEGTLSRNPLQRTAIHQASDGRGDGINLQREGNESQFYQQNFSQVPLQKTTQPTQLTQEQTSAKVSHSQVGSVNPNTVLHNEHAALKTQRWVQEQKQDVMKTRSVQVTEIETEAGKEEIGTTQPVVQRMDYDRENFAGEKKQLFDYYVSNGWTDADAYWEVYYLNEEEAKKQREALDEATENNPETPLKEEPLTKGIEEKKALQKPAAKAVKKEKKQLI